MLVCAIVRIMFSTTCEETTVWELFYQVQSVIFYLLQSYETSTKERFFISLVGPIGSGKSHLIFDWLKVGTFQQAFDKFFYFCQHYQPLYSRMQRKNLKFIQVVDFVLIENLPNNGTKYLLIFDDSCEENSNSKQFVKIATAGRHRGLNAIYIKHNLFHQSKLGRDVELQNTHIVLFKSPRDVLQINT